MIGMAPKIVSYSLALIILLSCLIIQSSLALQNALSVSSSGTINYSPSERMMFLPIYGQADFEEFPFSTDYRTSGYDWDWVNGYQIDIYGNRASAYGNQPITTDIYIKQSAEHVKSGSYSAEFHRSSGYWHCKLFEYQQDRYPENYWGKPQPEAYYSAWYWFPSNFQNAFTSGSWQWANIIQWADPSAGADGHFPTLWFAFQGSDGPNNNLRLNNENWWRDGGTSETRWNTGYTAATIPKDRWVHVVVYVKMASGFRKLDGKAIVWIDDRKVVEADIALWNYYTPNNKGVCWGVGNYGDYGGASVWIDDVQVYYP